LGIVCYLVLALYHIFERIVLLTTRWSAIANGSLGTGLGVWSFYHIGHIMIRLFLFILFLLLLYVIVRHLMKDMFIQGKKLNRQVEPEELVQDPYCQTYIQKRTAVRKRVGGRDYYFCDKECLRKFLEQKTS
jgi:YHS domain-containing protein